MEHENGLDTNDSKGAGTIPKNLEKRFDEMEIRGRTQAILTT